MSWKINVSRFIDHRYPSIFGEHEVKCKLFACRKFDHFCRIGQRKKDTSERVIIPATKHNELSKFAVRQTVNSVAGWWPMRGHGRALVKGFWFALCD